MIKQYEATIKKTKDKPGSEHKLVIEIGDNLLKAIEVIVSATDRENNRGNNTLHPGKEVKSAFGIDLTTLYGHYIKKCESYHPNVP